MAAKNEDENFERNAQNNAENIQVAADIAMESGNPYAAAAGAVVKVGDKVTGGKVSEGLGKATAKVTEKMPGGKAIQNASNQANESGLNKVAGKAASFKNGDLGDSDAGDALKKAQNRNNSRPENLRKNKQKKLEVPNGLKINASLPNEEIENEEKSGGKSGEDNGEGPLKGDGFFSKIFKRSIIIGTIVVAFFLLIIALPIVVIIDIGNFEDGFGISSETGGNTGGLDYTTSDKEADAFHKRVKEVNEEFMQQNKYIEPLGIAGLYSSLKTYNARVTYKNMTTKVIRDVAKLMIDETGYYNEETYRNNLMTLIFPSYFPNATQTELKNMTDTVFEYIENYKAIVGEDTTNGCSSSGSCEYDIKGFYFPSRNANVTKNIQVSNLKVRLMECGQPYGNGSYQKAIDQPLVDFESYIMGVVYAEIGTSYPDEAIKAQMVMARSFALSRPTGMGTKAGKKLAKENGQWILQISSCVADQVFCNVDAGCSYDCSGTQSQGGIVRSGIIAGSCKTRQPLASNHKIRTLANQTAGEVLVNSQGYIVSTAYVSSTQKKAKALAEKGYNYKQILLALYPSATNVSKSSCGSASNICGSTSSGSYANWKQKDAKWGSVRLGQSNQTISSAGCLVTSVAMLIAKSGVPTNVQGDFNPGTFVTALNKNGGFSGANFAWYRVTSVAPKFRPVQINYSLAGLSKEQKLNTIRNLVSQGYYVVAEVKGNTGQHWVAIDNVTGNTINMMDPGSSSTNMWAQYNWQNTSVISYFSVS